VDIGSFVCVPIGPRFEDNDTDQFATDGDASKAAQGFANKYPQGFGEKKRRIRFAVADVDYPEKWRQEWDVKPPPCSCLQYGSRTKQHDTYR
jgi:hypothetical protein